MDQSDILKYVKNYKEIKFIFEKISQAHRIKVELINRRTALIKKSCEDFTAVKDDQTFNSQLKDLTLKEQRVINIILQEGKNSENKITEAIHYLDKYRSEVSNDIFVGIRDAQSIYALHGKPKQHIKISAKELFIFLDETIIFLKSMEKDIEKSKTRMHFENKFLTSKTKESFEEYLSSWEQELESYYQLTKQHSKLLNQSKRVISERTKIDELSIAVAQGTIFIVTTAVGFASGTPQLGLIYFPITLLLGLVVKIEQITTSENVGFQIKKTNQDIIKLYRKKSKIGFWKKIFN